MLNRRGFLSALAAAVVLDPERLLWVPGKKLISIPKSVQPLGLFGLEITAPTSGNVLIAVIVSDSYDYRKRIYPEIRYC